MFRQLLEYIVNNSDIDYTQYLVFTKTGDGVCKVKSASGVTIPKVIIPNTVDLNGETLTVNEIEAEGFKNFTNYNYIIIPNTILTIGNQAFYGCSGLLSFNMPNSVTTIGTAIFRNCSSLTSFTLSTSLASLTNDLFRNCDSLTSVDLSQYINLTTMDKRVFNYCDGILTITLPEGMTSFDADCFSYCTKLTTINLPSTIEVIGDYLVQQTKIKKLVLPASIIKFNSSAFNDYSGLTDVYYKGTIGTWCNINFAGDYSSPTRLSSPNFYILDQNGSVSYEGNNYTKVLDLVIPEGVTTIPQSCFRGCKQFTSITIPSTVTSVGNYAFYNNNNVTVTYYNGTQAQWNNISIGSNNTKLTANVVYLQ